MPFHSGIYDALTKLYKFGVYVVGFDQPAPPVPPPVDCFLVDQAGDFIITMGDNSNVLVHCGFELDRVGDIHGNLVGTIGGSQVVAEIPE